MSKAADWRMGIPKARGGGPPRAQKTARRPDRPSLAQDWRPFVPMIKKSQAISLNFERPTMQIAHADLDRLDQAILRILSTEGRIAVTELARRIGLSKSPTQTRLK